MKYEREKARQINEENMSSSNVLLTQNQILGFLILAIANLMSSILLLNVGNIFLIGYLCLSLFEHIILESSNRKFLTQWTSLKDIITVVLGNEDDPDKELEDIESRNPRDQERKNNNTS